MIKYPYIDDQFEVFDFDFYHFVKKNRIPRIPGDGIFLGDGTFVRIIERDDVDLGISFTYEETPPNSYFMIYKTYHYSNRFIRSKRIAINTMGMGIYGSYYTFDENGNLKEVIDYDKFYSFSFEQVLDFCKTKGINNIPKGAIINRAQPFGTSDIQRGRWIQNKKIYIWDIDWNKPDRTFENFILSGQTGEIIEHGQGTYSRDGRDY